MSETGLIEDITSILVQMFAPDMEGTMNAHLSLFEAGVLDSINVVEFVIALEKRFQMRIHAAEIIPENFGSIEAIAALVERKRENAGSPGR